MLFSVKWIFFYLSSLWNRIWSFGLMIIGTVGRWVGGAVSKWSVVGWSLVGEFNKTLNYSELNNNKCFICFHYFIHMTFAFMSNFFWLTEINKNLQKDNEQVVFLRIKEYLSYYARKGFYKERNLYGISTYSAKSYFIVSRHYCMQNIFNSS